MTVTEEHPNRVRSIRMYDATWDLMEVRTPKMRSDPSKFTRDMTEAGLGFARCFRCLEPVKVKFGDLTGKPLAAWVAEAGIAVTRQHGDGHHPVTIGREAPEADTSRPSPGSAVFLEPGGSPVIAAAVPDRKKGRRN